MTNGELMEDGRLAEYVLGTLEPANVAEVETLLARSEEARAELRSLRASLVGLTEALPPMKPDPHVWTELKTRLESSPSTVPDLPPVISIQRQHSLQQYLGWGLAACLSLIALTELFWLNASQTAYQEVQREAYLITEFLAASDVEKISLYGRTREGLGSILTRPDGEALFVLNRAPAEGQNYQAWGHASDDWEPGSSDLLTSLSVSDDPIFEADTQNFATLYLSLEPEGGSPQPTYPLSRISLTSPAAASPLSIASPANGAVVDRASVIVTGVVGVNVTNLRYVLNGASRQTTVADNRFSFTAVLQRGTNTLVVQAVGPQGVTTETLILTRP